MRSIHACFAVVLLAAAAFAKPPALLADQNDVCGGAKKDACRNGGHCVAAPFEAEKFVCLCKDCFGGPNCQVNICPNKKEVYRLGLAQQLARIFLVVVVAVLGLAALVSFFLEYARQKKETRKVRELLAADSSDISRMTTRYSTSGGLKTSYCDKIRTAVSAPKRRPKVKPPSLSSFSIVSMAPAAPPAGRSRRLAWDEVEMRRHGLVDRFCHRPDDAEPKSVDVSVYERPPLTASRGSTVAFDSQTTGGTKAGRYSSAEF
ncbi:hypothetical protein L596_028863 [Steinernema carpocapsae]|uniref:EGF-like domain-containing protein n=1 Tax=Steinernema carpocapsae TaxID=34508 RepID=A0A4V5ZY07_STECR|nr:hypothetical protein L596_028863 [Steinernema carpocapsae]